MARLKNTRQSTCGVFLLVLIAFLLAPSAAPATCHTITPGGAGSKSGGDWSNACAGFSGNCAPSSMVRGDAYYVGAGTYTSPTGFLFNAPTSGTSVITIQAPTSADHCTDTGWNAGTMQGQAVFAGSGTATGNAIVDFETSYWTFNGAYNGCGTNVTKPFAPCRTGYGFKVNNNNGSNQPFNGRYAVVIDYTATGGGSSPVNNVVVEFVEIAGDADTTGTYCARGYQIESVINGTSLGSSTNDELLYSYIHDTSNGPAYFDGTTNFVADHNWFLRDWSTASCHSEVGIRAAGSLGTTNFTVSNNYFENLWSTAALATPSSSLGGVNGLNVYGNVFFCNQQELGMGAGTVPDCPGGDGFIFLFNNTFSNVNIYNNTFDGAFGGSNGTVDIADGVTTTVNTLNFQNNIFSHQTKSGLFCNSGATCNALTWSHTSYIDGASKPSGDQDPSSQVSASNLYINASTNTAGAND